MSQLNSAIAEHISGVLNLSEVILDQCNEWLAGHSAAVAWEAPAMQALVARLNQKTNGLVDLAFATKDGRLHHADGTVDAGPQDVSDRDWFRVQLEPTTTGMTIGNPIRSRRDGLWKVPLAMKASGGRDLAVLVAAIRLDKLAELHERQRMKPGGGISLVRDDGVVLSRVPLRDELLGGSFRLSPEFERNRVKFCSGFFLAPASPIDGRDRYAHFLRLDHYPVVIGIGIPVEDLLAEWHSETAEFVAGAAVISLFGGILAWRLFQALNGKEGATREVEAAYQRFFDIVTTVSGLVWELDAQCRFTFASARFETLKGLPAGEMLGRTPFELGLTSDPEIADKMAAQLPFTALHKGFHKTDGKPVISQVVGRPFFDQAGQFAGYRGVTTDLTEQKLAEAALKESKERLDAMLDNLPGVAFRLYTKENGDTESIYVSDALRDLTGWEPSQLVLAGHIGISHLMHPDDKGWVIPYRMYCLQHDIPFEATWRLLHADGGTRWVFNRSRGIRQADGGWIIDGLLIDVTEQEEAKRRLAERERQLSEILAAIDLTSDFISVTDADRKIIYVNRRITAELGFPPGAGLIGKVWQELQPASINETVAEALAAMEWSDHWGGEIEWIRPDNGQVIPLQVRRSRVPSGGYVIVASDITERRHHEDELRRQERREAQAGTMEALGQLAGGIAHDFNNILGAIRGFAHFLVEDAIEGSQDRQFAMQIVAAAERGRSLVERIMAFSRREAGRRLDLRLADAMQDTVDLLRATLPASTSLVVENELPAAVVLADRTQLAQVLINLCVNASDALNEASGVVSVAVRAFDRQRGAIDRPPPATPTPGAVETWQAEGSSWLLTGSLPAGPAVAIAVTDGGQGIPVDVMRHVFEPFFTTKAPGRGTGLGLAVVHRIALDHDAAILIRSTAGMGTSIEFILPLSEGLAAAEVVPLPTVRRPADSRAATVMVVDDDEAFLAMMQVCLERLGHDVVATGDPREALMAIEESPGLWQLLVTDQTMPHLDGLRLVERVKALSPGTKCIICSGFSSGLTAAKALAAGADGYLGKPLDLDAFANLVVQLLARE